jgi:flagellar M-ring protein FliF
VERLRDAFNRLNSQQKLIFMIAVAAVFAIIVGTILWSRQPDWKTLFSNLTEKDGGAIVTILEQQTSHIVTLTVARCWCPLTVCTK